MAMWMSTPLSIAINPSILVSLNTRTTVAAAAILLLWMCEAHLHDIENRLLYNSSVGTMFNNGNSTRPPNNRFDSLPSR
jgi:hypothetical protein